MKSIKAICVVNRKNPRIKLDEIYRLSDETRIDKDEKIIKIEIKQI